VDPNNHNRLAPPGVVGELLLEGPLLVSECVRNNERSSRAFTNDPAWAMVEGGHRCFFKTCKLGRYDDNGAIILFGRKDMMTNLGGQRIDLDMIETYIRHACNSLDTTVHVVNIENNEQRLVALISNGVVGGRPSRKDMGLRLDVSQDMLQKIVALQAFLSDNLPVYMVPDMIIPVKSLAGAAEKDPNGLAKNYAIEWISYQSEQTVPPLVSDDFKGTSISLLRDFWAEILNLPVDSISPTDSFFGIGGDSISAIRLSMATTLYSLETRLTVADIFQRPRLCDMAGSFTTSLLPLSGKSGEVEKFSLIESFGTIPSILKILQSDWGLRESAIEDILPCTPLQEALMALSVQHQGAYVAQFVYKLPSNLNTDKFVKAWQATVKAFEVLRTRIVPSEGHCSLQVIVPDDDFAWHDCKSLSELCVLNIAPNRYGKALASFCLEGLDDPATDSQFIMHLNHAIYDTWSLYLILEHVEAVYFARPTVGVKPFRSFVEYLVQSDGQSHDAFWMEELKDLHATDFPQLQSLSPKMSLRTSSQPLAFGIDNKPDFTLSTIIQAA
jgi:hypothetical protein